MKKVILSTIVILSGIFSLSAQDKVVQNVMTKGTSMANIGIGLPVLSSNYKITFPPLNVFYEVGIMDLGRPGSIAVGAHVGFWGYKIKTDFDQVKYKYFNTLLGLRGAYHFTIINNWEVYGGTILGIKLESERVKVGSESTKADTFVRFGWQVFGGTRYMITPSLGAFAEFGYGFLYGSIGITYRF